MADEVFWEVRDLGVYDLGWACHPERSEGPTYLLEAFECELRSR